MKKEVNYIRSYILSFHSLVNINNRSLFVIRCVMSSLTVDHIGDLNVSEM